MPEAPAATATETNTETQDPAPAATATQAPDDFTALADLNLTPEQIRERLNASRKWEDRAKSNFEKAQELDRIKREQLPAHEREVQEAAEAARADERSKVAGRLVDAEVKAAAVGRNTDIDALLDGLDRKRFLTDDGDPDVPAITAWLDKVAPKAEASTVNQFIDLGQGARSESATALNGDPLLASIRGRLGIG